MLTKKSLNFKNTRHNISVPLVMSTNLLIKSPKQLEKNPEKVIPWQMLDQDRPDKTQPHV